jgi:hypothetical protein
MERLGGVRVPLTAFDNATIDSEGFGDAVGLGRRAFHLSEIALETN